MINRFPRKEIKGEVALAQILQHPAAGLRDSHGYEFLCGRPARGRLVLFRRASEGPSGLYVRVRGCFWQGVWVCVCVGVCVV